MWTYEHSVDTRAGAQAIFALFKDVGTWSAWNAGVEQVDLDGPFAAGTTGTMVVPGQEPFAFRLTWVEEGQGFEDETEIPEAGVVVRVGHHLETLNAGLTRVTYSVKIDGPGADEAGPGIGPAIVADFPEVMSALVARAEAVTAPQ
jgi:hypothetical protein